MNVGCDPPALVKLFGDALEPMELFRVAYERCDPATRFQLCAALKMLAGPVRSSRYELGEREGRIYVEPIGLAHDDDSKRHARQR